MKMNEAKSKISRMKSKLALAGTTAMMTLLSASPVLADASAGQVQSKITNVAHVVQGVLTGLNVVVGICVALFIILKRMPDADDPREKSEVYHAVGRVAGLVALGAAIVWLLPWVYSLFQ